MRTIQALSDLCENSYQRVLVLTSLFVFAYAAGSTLGVFVSI